ncbi:MULTISPECIES: type I glyceraldehyde-3-phosphate dehydrogenase [unclassified Nitratiruptor]|uniref:type I glyceraldehyde-3-phosphate dehydrogenase n=1 Tax=unclassified Nitratiruptor TaxID=2624044 RepID=UPI0019167424|nr:MULTISPECIES: type I glyceraldehyde-3-phosphate dehydrogenase [unclassified Nitratiruptor]BCD60794.1 glyceraldehyde 3-phosphate dehydrogenase [Nitratiruptor sp. YY08-10]BCD64726.1 glyceraldehyde 3-phosphate dehydrogenase [Nitratiruptor sp. YY08-14]
MAVRIGINGFGRIGRAVARNLFQRDGFELVAINDLMDTSMMAYLLRYDSVHGPFPDAVETLDEDKLKIDGKEVYVSHASSPKEIPLPQVDVLIESTGRFLSSDLASGHLRYAKKVIISAPATDETVTFVYGVNHSDYKGEEIISNASCTTNCLAPIAKLIDEAYGIEKGLMTTIHSYTIDQNLLDSDHQRDIRRSRAAAVNMVPTTTGAAKAIHRVLPNLQGKLHGRSVRVPVPDVSLMDLDLHLKKSTTKEELNELFIEASNGTMKGILGVDDSFMVSQDVVGKSFSSIVALDLTQVIGGDMVKVMSWYDNEWGYANRLLDMAHFITKEYHEHKID